MVEYNPFSQDVMRDPHPVYKQLRAEAPVYHIDEFDAWAYSKFDDIWDAAMDDANYSTALGSTSSHLLTKVQPVTPMLNLMDPPEHTKLRAQVRKHFQPAAIRSLEPAIRDMAIQCVDAGLERGELDVMSDFASQVSVKVACMVIGIPLEDGDLMNDLVWRFMKRDPKIDGMTPDALKAMEELFGYFVQLSQDRRKSGSDADDVVNLLNRVEVGGEKLDDMSIASHMSLYIIGGSETFPKVFAAAIRRLAEHPEQRAACVADPSRVPNAFQEALRYDMPTQFLCRTAVKDHEVRDQKIREGQPILFLYASANRDEDEFENPDVFDIHRKIPRVLSFGHGTHGCIGLHVAKLEARVCLEEALRRMPEYTLDMANAERVVTDFVQGYARLPIRVRPS